MLAAHQRVIEGFDFRFVFGKLSLSDCLQRVVCHEHRGSTPGCS